MFRHRIAVCDRLARHRVSVLCPDVGVTDVAMSIGLKLTVEEGRYPKIARLATAMAILAGEMVICKDGARSPMRADFTRGLQSWLTTR